jgi:hypothetical protein
MKTVVGFCLALLAMGQSLSAAMAAGSSPSSPSDQEQWLAYRVGAPGEGPAGATSGQMLDLSNQKPDGVELPTFVSPQPLFAKWKTPMAPAGFLWIALDSSKEDGAYDRLFIDTNADGRLSDEKPAIATYAQRVKNAQSLKEMQSSFFATVKVLLPSPDGPVAYHLNASLRIQDTKAQLLTTAAGWYEGAIQVGGRQHTCVLFDADCNGAFDDAREDFRQSDRIKIDNAPEAAIGRVGKYISVDGKFWSLQVARDGAWVRFIEPKDLTLGVIRVSGGVARLGVGGASGLFVLPVENGQASLPVGAYRLNRWELQRKDAAGAVWTLSSEAPPTAPAFTVAADKPVTLDLGEPITSTVTVRGPENREYSLTAEGLTGRLGERVTLTRGQGSSVEPPHAVFRNADGSYERRFTFEYG